MESNKLSQKNFNWRADGRIKRALLKAHGILEGSKISEEINHLKVSEDKYDSFLEAYLMFSEVFCAVLAIAAVCLAIFFPPNFMRVALANNEGFLHLLFVFLYILAVAFLSIGFVFGLFGVFGSVGADVFLGRGKKIDNKLIHWTQKQKSKYIFKRLKPYRKYKYSYGHWQDSIFEVDEKFFTDALMEIKMILSEAQGSLEQEKELITQRIIAAKEKRDTDELIIACYLDEFKNLKDLKLDL